jgi:hypothetical protein
MTQSRHSALRTQDSTAKRSQNLRVALTLLAAMLGLFVGSVIYITAFH